jgi:O-antigen/teichoic acid export membrane protein
MTGVGRSLARGGAWMIGLRWAMRCLGLLNTFILARLLSPGDFGLVAMAMLVVGLVEMLGQTGQQLALIRNPDPTRADFDSAWTLGIIIAVALTLLLWALAPFAPRYFHAPRASGLIAALALRTLVGGFDNIGVVAFRRELRFDREFRFLLLQRLATILLTVAAALWLRDARALVVGIVGGRALGVALSYALHPYRPRWCVTRIGNMLAFSGWMLAVHLAQYMHDKADEMVVGGVASPAAMGLYSVAADAATAPTVEVVLPVARALFPVFARLADDRAAVRAAYLDVFSATCLICLAVGPGVALVAQDFVALALGPRWLEAVPLVRILALAGGLYGIMQNSISVVSATGHARLTALLTGTRAALLLAALAVAALLGSLQTIAITRAALTLAFIPGIFLAVSRVLPVTAADMVLRTWRPAAAAVVMAAVVLAVHALAPAQPWLRLPLDAGAGAVAYAGMVLLLWRLSGAPPGPEAAVVAGIRRRSRRR